MDQLFELLTQQLRKVDCLCVFSFIFFCLSSQFTRDIQSRSLPNELVDINISRKKTYEDKETR